MLARVLLATAALAGCRQVFGIDDTDVAADGAVRGPDAGRDAAPSPSCPIDAQSRLRLCLLFEDPVTDGIASDGSGHDLHATLEGVVAATRGGEAAARMDVASSARVVESADLDLAVFSIAAWVHPLVRPAPGTRMGVIDNNMQYGMYVTDLGGLLCRLASPGGATIVVEAPGVPVDAWSYVACTFDGALFVALAIDEDGDRSMGVAPYTGAVHIGGPHGTQIGANRLTDDSITEQLDGMIDNVWIWAAARSPDELCGDAGICP
jgi:hypothetical protein